MLVIDEILVQESVINTKFACDLSACKGACCTFAGGRGAPLRDEEISEIENAYPFVEPYLPPEHRATIEQHGMIDGYNGEYATQCVEHKACVFVYFESGIARCGIEKAFLDGKISFRKPLSCHLFPIRIGRDGKEIHFEYFSECEPALAQGNKNNIPVYEFTNASLQRVFGPEWTDTLKKAVTNDSVK